MREDLLSPAHGSLEIADVRAQKQELVRKLQSSRNLDAHGRAGLGVERLGLLQKELIKLRERNQELLLEQGRLLAVVAQHTGGGSQQGSHLLGVPKPVSVPGSPTLKPRPPRLQANSPFSSEETESQDFAQKPEIERLQAEVADQETRFRLREQELQDKVTQLEKRVRHLEGELLDSEESNEVLAMEKEALEKKLGETVRRLELALQETGPDSDVKKNVASLMKQLEHLHTSHKQHVASAQQLERELESEQAKRLGLEAELVISRRKLAEQEAKAAAPCALCASSKEAVSEMTQARAALEEAKASIEALKEELHQEKSRKGQLEESKDDDCWASAAPSEAEALGVRTLRPPLRPPGQASEARETGPGGTGLLSILEEVQAALTAREKELLRRRAAASTGDNGFGISPIGAAQTGSPMQDFCGFAKSLGFLGDASRIWEEAEAQVAAFCPPRAPQVASFGHQADSWPVTRSRGRAVAEDVQLRLPGGEEGLPAVPLRGSLPLLGGSCAMGAYPESPGRIDPWSDDLNTEVVQIGGSSPSRSGPTFGTLLPPSVRQLFAEAERCCDQQRFAEALPLFQKVLDELKEQEGPTPSSAKAEVWAHFGVALQSLDRVTESIEAYKQSVQLDPSLHVCLANLAALHAYLGQPQQADEYITKALAIEPNNPTYDSIRQQILAQPSVILSVLNNQPLEALPESAEGGSEGSGAEAEQDGLFESFGLSVGPTPTAPEAEGDGDPGKLAAVKEGTE